MRCTNKYKASAEFWSAILLSREGSSRRLTKRMKAVNVDLLNNYHLIVLNIATQHTLIAILVFSLCKYKKLFHNMTIKVKISGLFQTSLLSMFSKK